MGWLKMNIVSQVYSGHRELLRIAADSVRDDSYYSNVTVKGFKPTCQCFESALAHK